jgi:hypothetical protein
MLLNILDELLLAFFVYYYFSFDCTVEKMDKNETTFIERLRCVIKYRRIVIWPKNKLSVFDGIILLVIVVLANIKNFS